MKYRLKDRQLQKKLDALSDALRFSDRLQKSCQEQNSDKADYIFVRFGNFVLKEDGDQPCYTAHILKSDIEEYEEYNPKAWNKFPEVEPPEGVWMRCVMTDIHHKNRIVRVGAQFSTGAWRDHEGVAFEPRFRVDKFRPWDEDEESK